MKPTITAFETSPDRGQGLARDMRVRWALEEVGQPYDVELRSFKALKEARHCALNPFGQIPTYEEGGLTLFESGSILLRIGEQHPGLLPADPDARSRAITWMFAALSTMEPPIVNREAMILMEKDKDWFAERMKLVEAAIRTRLGQLSRHLADKDWIDGEFSAADILMVTVLRRGGLQRDGILGDYPNLEAYVARGEARPAYQRAFAAQYKVFEEARAKA